MLQLSVIQLEKCVLAVYVYITWFLKENLWRGITEVQVFCYCVGNSFLDTALYQRRAIMKYRAECFVSKMYIKAEAALS